MASAIGLGVRYARFTPPFRRLLAVAAMFALTSGVVQSLLATLTAESLDAGAFAYGALLGAMGAGALLGAFTCGAAAERLAERHVGVAVATFGLAGIAVGLSPGSGWRGSPSSSPGSPGCGPWRLSTPPSSCSSRRG